MTFRTSSSVITKGKQPQLPGGNKLFLMPETAFCIAVQKALVEVVQIAFGNSETRHRETSFPGGVSKI